MSQAAHRLAAAIFSTLVCSGASAAVVATNASYGVVDGRETTRALEVAARGTITDLNITVAFSKCDDPPIGPDGTRCRGSGSPFENEFALALVAPNGERVELVRAFDTYVAGGVRSGAGRVAVSFDDEALLAAGPRVQAGSFRPAGALSAFDGMDMYGSWTLYLQDATRGDPLEFFSASLDIAFEVPEPGTLAMLGLGVLGMRRFRRR